MKTAHTPGPWTIGNPIFSGPYYIMVGGHTEIARVSDAPATSSDYYIKNHYEREANARLIAAAPDLLDILDRILRAHESGNNGAVMGEATLCKSFAYLARSAVNKAKGL